MGSLATDAGLRIASADPLLPSSKVRPHQPSVPDLPSHCQLTVDRATNQHQTAYESVPPIEPLLNTMDSHSSSAFDECNGVMSWDKSNVVAVTAKLGGDG
jgi:hypothetical protein